VLRADNIATFMCQLSGSSGSLNLLELEGPVQPCTEITLTLLSVFLQSSLCSLPLYFYNTSKDVLLFRTFFFPSQAITLFIYTLFSSVVIRSRTSLQIIPLNFRKTVTALTNSPVAYVVAKAGLSVPRSRHDV